MTARRSDPPSGTGPGVTTTPLVRGWAGDGLRPRARRIGVRAGGDVARRLAEWR